MTAPDKDMPDGRRPALHSRYFRSGEQGKEKTMDDHIVLATGNRKKFSELTEVLRHFPVTLHALKNFDPMPEPIEDGVTFRENACKKATHYARLLGLPCMADDTGLVVDALDGRPGIHSARYAGLGTSDKEKCDKLLAELAGISHRTAHFSCVLALATPDGQALTWEGRCDGTILTERRGEEGFGYDPLFLVTAAGKTLAEIALEEKSRLSHRGRALIAFRADFDRVLVWMRQRMEAFPPPQVESGWR
jgi:XTP/dITP diphosphohydrolase